MVCFHDMFENLTSHAVQGYNQVGNAGAVGLGEGLKLNSSLQTLNLVSDLCWCSWCLHSEGFVGFHSMTLCLQVDNNVGDAGVLGLGEGLKGNSSLQTLNLVSLLFSLRFLFVLST